MELNTHLGIDRGWVGTPSILGEGRARVTLTATPAMAADAEGLVHGGFVFGAADLAAMAAVNDPNVVLGSASVRFTAPVRVGETVEAEARITGSDGKKRQIEVEARVGERVVLTGTLTAFVLERHVLG